MEKLNKLIQRCKCGVHLTINKHRDYYETVEQHFKSNPINEEKLEDIDKGVYEKMKQLNTIIELHFYPDTPIGFYVVYHYDLEKAIDDALTTLNVA